MGKLAEALAEYRYSKVDFHCSPETYQALDRLLPRKGFYLDVGAHDGRTFSNTWHLDIKSQWSGILIEPILHQYFEMRKQRSERNKFFYCACVGEEYKSDHLPIIYAGLMSISPATSDWDADAHSNEGRNFITQHHTTELTYAPARTLNSILMASDAPRLIDLLSLDVEGAELSVLNGIDLNEFKFKVIIIETAIDSEAYKRLLNYGYILSEELQGNLIFRLDFHDERHSKLFNA